MTRNFGLLFLKGTLFPTRHLPLPLVIAGLLALSACDSSVKESLGLARRAPDEFTVVSRPALSVPPDFTLRPPRPGEAMRGPSADETAHGLLIGHAPTTAQDPSELTQPTVDTAVTPVIATSQATTAETSFLKHAGGDDAKDDIRSQLLTDEATPADTSNAKSLLEKVTGAAKDEPVIDAKKEAERLRDNKDAGKAPTDGDIAVEKVKPPTLLDRIF